MGEVDDVLGAGEAAEENGLGDGSGESGLGEGKESSSEVISETKESPIGSAPSLDDVVVEAGGLDVGETDDEGGGLGVGEFGDEGLPEVATPPGGPPVARLDYGQRVQTGQLVDMFG